MSQAIFLPTGNGSVTNVYTYPYTGTTCWGCVDDPVGTPDDSTSYVYTNAFGSADALFTFSTPQVPSGAIVNYIRITSRIQSYVRAGVNAILRVGGTTYTSSVFYVPLSSWGSVNRDFITNPKTGLSWTVNDVNGTGANPLQWFGNRLNTIIYDKSYGSSFLTQVYMIVDYTYTEAGSFGVFGGCGAGQNIGGAWAG